MSDEIKEITKVDKQLLDKIEHILASELNCKEYDEFYNYFNEIRKPNILIDIKDDENIKDYITNLQEENEHLDKVNCILRKNINNNVYKSRVEKAVEYIKEHQRKDEFLNLNEWETRDLLNILQGGKDE